MNAYDDMVVADGAVAYWKLDDPGFPIIDSVGSSNIASGSSSIGFLQPGPQLNVPAVNLNGASIATGFSFSAAPAVSFECWMRSTSNVTLADERNGAIPGVFVGFGAGYANNGTGTPNIGWEGGVNWIGRRGLTNFADGKWHHVVGTWQGAVGGVQSSQFAFYVDAVRVDTQDTAYGADSSTTLTSSTLTIGAGSTSIAKYAVYRTALNATQVSAHYAALSVVPLSGVWSMV